jgi:hypothetical protein
LQAISRRRNARINCLRLNLQSLPLVFNDSIEAEQLLHPTLSLSALQADQLQAACRDCWRAQCRGFMMPLM